jgi:hypothetical protein
LSIVYKVFVNILPVNFIKLKKLTFAGGAAAAAAAAAFAWTDVVANCRV